MRSSELKGALALAALAASLGAVIWVLGLVWLDLASGPGPLDICMETHSRDTCLYTLRGEH